MEWLNYHHLLYFWTVAREGTIARASETLRLAQPTISGQIRMLEEAFGEKLFQRSGRNLVLTDVGRMVYGYADEIFSLGRELIDTLKDRPTGRPLRFQVGVADNVSKLIAYRLLQPAMTLAQPVHIVCREDTPERLLAQLATHDLDLVVADAPVAAAVKIKAYSHPLGDSPLSIVGTPALASKVRRGFPQSLHGAPLLLPTDHSTIRRHLDQWFEVRGIRPFVTGEFDDSALLKVFAQGGAGLCAVPTVIEGEVVKQYDVAVAGRLDDVRQRYYAVSVERRLKHPAVLAISEAAHQFLGSVPVKSRSAPRSGGRS